jgi:hypothetical protein
VGTEPAAEAYAAAVHPLLRPRVLEAMDRAGEIVEGMDRAETDALCLPVLRRIPSVPAERFLAWMHAAAPAVHAWADRGDAEAATLAIPMPPTDTDAEANVEPGAGASNPEAGAEAGAEVYRAARVHLNDEPGFRPWRGEIPEGDAERRLACLYALRFAFAAAEGRLRASIATDAAAPAHASA